MDTINGFDVQAIREVATLHYQLAALGMALTECQIRARENNCRAWFYRAVCARLVDQMQAVENKIKGVIGAQELKVIEADHAEPPLFVENRR